MVPWVTTNRPLCQVPVPRPRSGYPLSTLTHVWSGHLQHQNATLSRNYASLKASWPHSYEINLDQKYYKNHHSLYIENCLENIFVIHVKGNIERLLLPGNFEMSIIFFLLSFQFFLYKILSVEFETDLGYSLQMQNWNDQIKSKNDISI